MTSAAIKVTDDLFITGTLMGTTNQLILTGLFCMEV